MRAVGRLLLGSVFGVGLTFVFLSACTGLPGPAGRPPETGPAPAAVADAGPDLVQPHFETGYGEGGRQPRDESGEPEQSPALVPPLPSPLPIQALLPERWFDASKSPVRPITRPFGVCIRDSGGCPFGPARLPTCPEGQGFLDIESRTQLEGLVGTETVLRGELNDARTAAVPLCVRPRCCHVFAPGLDIRVTRPGPAPSDDIFRGSVSVVLKDSRFPYAFGCPGDDVTTCCALATGAVVLVSGTVARASAGPTLFEILNPRLCRANATRSDKP